MSTSLIHTLYLALAYLLLFASAEGLYHVKKMDAEITRKYVHLVTGLLTMLFPPLIGNHWLVLALCGSFMLILVASKIWNLLPSINGVDRLTRGSFLYPVIVYSCYLAYQFYGQLIFYYVPILVLALADPSAALFGKKWRWKPYTLFGQTKTLGGSLGFVVVAFLTCALLLTGFEQYALSKAIFVSLGISLVTVVAESMTHNGWDNLTIPASAVLVLVLMKELMVL